jgi:membrane fusion protein (multidrug efflux system)
MSTAFSRTLRSLNADGFGRPAAAISAAACLAGIWGAWCGLAHVTLYEITGNARIEVGRAVTPVQSPMTARVMSAQLTLGREVHVGDVLVELDSEPEQLQARELRARLAALAPQVQALRDQAAAEERAGAQERMAGRAAGDEARSGVREAEAPARFAENEEQRLSQLRASGLIPEREYQRGQAEAQRSRAAAETQQLAVLRLEEDQRTRQSDRATRLKSLAADIARLESEIPTIQASIARLEYEIERRRVRAPMTGRLGEAAVLRPGAVVREGEKLGAIVPDGRLAIVAQFPPPAALGRIRAGQTARLRLQGFPWMQYGSLNAKVTQVASEVRDNSVRVELAVDGQPPAGIPLQHGMPGTLEVEIERVTPAALVLRTAGRMLASPRSAFTPGDAGQ